MVIKQSGFQNQKQAPVAKMTLSLGGHSVVMLQKETGGRGGLVPIYSSTRHTPNAGTRAQTQTHDLTAGFLPPPS